MYQTHGYDSVQTIFLDRDGVLNQKASEGAYVSRWEHFHMIPGTAQAIRLLNERRLPVYVVTNQRGVALGLYTVEDVNQLHLSLQEELHGQRAHIEGFFYCPHEKGSCNCRKPKPGLFQQAQYLHPEIDFTTSVMIGDSLSDIEAGECLGMKTIFIEGDSNLQKEGADRARSVSGMTCGSLLEAVRLLLGVT